MKIKLNGSPCDITVPSLHALHQLRGSDSDITILNGYATADDLPIKAGDEIFFIPKKSLPPKDALEAMLYARHTPRIQEKLKSGIVAIAGLGGLGSNAAIYLARIGVGTLHLIDFDTVDASNLNRQAYRVCDLGIHKTEALANQIKEINPFITVRVDTVRVTEENVRTLFAQDDIVCEAFDNPTTKGLLIDALLTEFPEKYVVSASGMAGYGNSNAIITKKITDHFYLCGDGISGAEPGRGLMAPRVALCAAHEANMIVELLVDILQK